MTIRIAAVVLATSLVLAGCSKKDVGAPATADPSSGTAGTTTAADGAKAELGKAAPDFTLKSMAGEDVTLSKYQGKVVVLEWFNPDCPFVKDAHTNGSLKGMAARYRDKDVVWLAINSGAEGMQGHGDKANREGKGRYGIDYPILFDAEGRVGHMYEAERTPQIYVIDREGKLAYRGALDTTRGDAEDAEGITYYAADAIDDVIAGKPARRTETKAWGCSVKYARR